MQFFANPEASSTVNCTVCFGSGVGVPTVRTNGFGPRASSATRFVTVLVTGGANTQECLEVAYTVAESPLVKTALFAGDANWGRFCMAIGRAQVADLDASKVALWLDDVQVAEDGLMSSSYTEAAGSAVLAQDEFKVTIDLGRGNAEETIWTTDLSYEYVRINAEYRS